MGQQILFALRQSTHRAVVTLVNFVPGIVAFLVAVILLGLIGALLAMLVRRILTGLKFDERMSARPGAVDWTPTQSPSLLASRAVLWICIFAGLVIGISAFDSVYQANQQVSLFVLPYLTHAVGAVLVLIIGSIAARFLARSVLIGGVNAQLQYARFLALGIKWLVLVLSAAMALDHLGVGGSIVDLAFGILFGGIVLTLSLAIGLGSRDLVSRSIEKTMDRPSANPQNVSPIDTQDPTRTRLRHF